MQLKQLNCVDAALFEPDQPLEASHHAGHTLACEHIGVCRLLEDCVDSSMEVSEDRLTADQ